MDIKEQILVALGLNKTEEEVVLAYQAKSEDGTIFVSSADELEAGVDISVLTEDGTTILLPVGTYKTDTGVSFRVEEEGIVAEVIESETEEEDTEEEVDAGYDDEKEEMTESVNFMFPETDAEKADWAKSYEEMKDKVDNLIDAVADLKRDKDGGDDEVEELAEEVEEPTTNPKSIKTTEVVEFSAEDELTKLKEENEKLKTELAAQPASAPLDTNKFSSDRKPMARKEYNKLSRREKFLHDLNK
jgi:predicted RNase H-like nuclease (RuvC/YqgF family)